MSVLVVDDQPLNRILLGKLLRSLNLHVIEAGDGRAGLEAYLQYGRSVGLVFMDIVMPVCNGIQAVMSIRSAESRQGWVPVPIVAYTSEDVQHGSPLWHECMQSGFNDVVSKPVNKRFATQLLYRWMPGLQQRCASTLAGTAAMASGSCSDGSSDDEVVCDCSSGSRATCIKCSSSSSSAASTVPGQSSTGFTAAAIAAVQAMASAAHPSGSCQQSAPSSTGSDGSPDNGTSACSPRTVPPQPTHHV